MTDCTVREKEKAGGGRIWVLHKWIHHLPNGGI